jgi:hypothetical protein
MAQVLPSMSCRSIRKKLRILYIFRILLERAQSTIPILIAKSDKLQKLIEERELT